jgi:acyl-CoA hydrolase
MEVGVRVHREDPLNGTSAHTASAYLTFVAIDQYGKPLPVPQLVPQTEAEKRRFEDALYRREQRLKNRDVLKNRQDNHQ